MRFLLPVLVLVGLFAAPVRAQEPMLLPLDPTPLVIVTASGERNFAIEVADTPEKRQRGLMFRRSMADDHGMLFVFEQSGPLGFWMKNTPMALDLLFIGEDGRIRAVASGKPFSTDSIAPPVDAQFVLELKAGTAQKAGIAIGDRLRHPLIDAVAGKK